MAKAAFNGVGRFGEKPKEFKGDALLDIEKAGQFLIGAYYTKKVRLAFQDALHPTRKTIRWAIAEALDDWLEKNGQERCLVNTLVEEDEERLAKKLRMKG